MPDGRCSTRAGLPRYVLSMEERMPLTQSCLLQGPRAGTSQDVEKKS